MRHIGFKMKKIELILLLPYQIYNRNHSNIGVLLCSAKG
jgi:hypothetical protein